MKKDNWKNIRFRLLAFAIILSVGVALRAEAFRIANDADTTRVMTLVRENFTPGGDPASIAGKIAESLIGARREEVTMNDSLGTLFIRTDAFDDMGFLNMVTAISRLATSPGHKRVNEFAKELESVTFRRGEEKGFPSRMLYFSDWVVDNKVRNNVKEMTEYNSDQFRTKSLEKVTRNREKYAALKDSATYEDQKMVEMGFRTHKVPHLKREQAANKDILSEMRDGDIVVLLTSDPQTDALDIGFVRKRDDGFHFIHPSVDTGTIVEESETLDRYLKRIAKRTYGWRWLRLQK
ncbi:MAG: DUF1460 domain-containing protein [Muribaculaceae bacterium]|nr:DUF1460 domain-containing protein [Muribaculaceae bacterium]